MKLKISIKDNLIEAILLSEKKVVDRVKFTDINNLSEKLLPSIDQLLCRNKVSLAKIKKIESEIDIPESYTATRIAQTVIKALNLRIKK